MTIGDYYGRKLILSKHLIAVQYDKKFKVIFNRINGNSLYANTDLLAFLDRFKMPVTIEDIENEFAIDDIKIKIQYLIDKKFVSDFNCDEEIDYIRENKLYINKNKKYTENFCLFYPKEVIYPIPYLTILLEKVYSYIIKRGLKKLNRKSIVFVCEDTKEFESLWGKEKIPDSVNFFVTHGRIIAIRPDQVYLFAIADEAQFKALVHELIHIFLCENYTNLPIWCTEGLCEYYSNNSYNVSLDELIEIKGLYRFSDLSRIVEHSIMDIDTSRIEFNIGYRQSASFIKYLADLLGEDRLMECVMETGLRIDFEKNFNETFSYTLEHYELEWRKTLSIK